MGGTPTHPSPTPSGRRGRVCGRDSHSPFSHSLREKGEGLWEGLPLTLLPLPPGEGGGFVGGTPTHPSPTPSGRRGRVCGRDSHSPFSHSLREKGEGLWEGLPLTLLPLPPGEGGGFVGGTPTHPSPTPSGRRGRVCGRDSHSPFSHSLREKGEGLWEGLPLTLLPLPPGEGGGFVGGTPTHPSPTPSGRRGRVCGRDSHSPFSHSLREKGEGLWEGLPLTLLPLPPGEGGGFVGGTPTHPSPTPSGRRGRVCGRDSHSPFSHSLREKGEGLWEGLPLTLLPLPPGEGGGFVGGTPTHPSPTPSGRRGRVCGRDSHSPFSHSLREKGEGLWEGLPLTLLPLPPGEGGGFVGGTPTHPSPTPSGRRGRVCGRDSHSPFSHSLREKGEGLWEGLPLTLLPLPPGEGGGFVGGTPTHPSPTPSGRRGRVCGRDSHSPFSHSLREKGEGLWEGLPLTLLPLPPGEGGGFVGGTPTHPSPTPSGRRGRVCGRDSHSPFSHSLREKGEGLWEGLPLTLLPLPPGEGGGFVGGTPTHPSPTPSGRRGRVCGRDSHSPFSHSLREKGEGLWEGLPLTLPVLIYSYILTSNIGNITHSLMLSLFFFYSHLVYK